MVNINTEHTIRRALLLFCLNIINGKVSMFLYFDISETMLESRLKNGAGTRKWTKYGINSADFLTEINAGKAVKFIARQKRF